MNTISKIVNICTDEIPAEYFGKTCNYFSFEVLDGEPVHLFLIITMDDERLEKVVISGLNETYISLEPLITFLKTITVDNSNPYHPVSLDLKFARDKYGVHIPVTKGSKKSIEEKVAELGYIDCPVCGQQLIPLEPLDEYGVYDYWCNVCDIDIHIEVNGTKGEENG